MMTTRIWSLVVVAACSTSNGHAPPHNVAPRDEDGVISPAQLPDFDVERGVSTPRDCRLSKLLRRFADARVIDCGSFEYGQPVKQLVAARECAAKALATRRPFLVRSRDGGGDSICNDWAIEKDHVDANLACGGHTIDQTRMLLGIIEGGGYATYWLDYGWSRFEVAPIYRKPGDSGISVRGTSELRRCVPLVALPVDETDSACLYDPRLENCFDCQNPTEITSCESDRDL